MENELTLAIAGLKEPSPGLTMHVLLQKHMLHAKGYFFPNSKMHRSYPVAFGLKVQRMLPKLLAKCSGPPALPFERHVLAPAMFQQMDFGPDTWSEAKLMECCVYMRGSKHLVVPERWKSAFPTHISEDWL